MGAGQPTVAGETPRVQPGGPEPGGAQAIDQRDGAKPRGLAVAPQGGRDREAERWTSR
jgi:hypothetical protein